MQAVVRCRIRGLPRTAQRQVRLQWRELDRPRTTALARRQCEPASRFSPDRTRSSLVITQAADDDPQIITGPAHGADRRPPLRLRVEQRIGRTEIGGRHDVPIAVADLRAAHGAASGDHAGRGEGRSSPAPRRPEQTIAESGPATTLMSVLRQHERRRLPRRLFSFRSGLPRASRAVTEVTVAGAADGATSGSATLSRRFSFSGLVSRRENRFARSRLHGFSCAVDIKWTSE